MIDYWGVYTHDIAEERAAIVYIILYDSKKTTRKVLQLLYLQV